MKENISRIAERGERLDQLSAKSDELAVSAQAFRHRARKNTWYDLLSTPVSWVGSALGAVSSIPARLWQGQSDLDLDAPVPEPITFTHEVEEDVRARKGLLAAAIGTKIGRLPANQIGEYTHFREQVRQPESTIDECTKEQTLLFKAVFDDFDENASGKVPIENLGDMIRRLGYDPADRALDIWCIEAGIRPESIVTFESMLPLLLLFASRPSEEEFTNTNHNRLHRDHVESNERVERS